MYGTSASVLKNYTPANQKIVPTRLCLFRALTKNIGLHKARAHYSLLRSEPENYGCADLSVAFVRLLI